MVLIAAAAMVLRWGSRSSQAGNDVLTSSAPIRPAAGVVAPSKIPFLTALSQLPLRFEANAGQSDPGVKFLAHGNGYSLFLTSDGATMSLRRQSSSSRQTEFVRMKLVGASENVSIGGTDLLPGKSNYFLGNDASRWRVNVAQFERVKYENVYPGINLLFYGNQGRLEYDFQIAPGVDPSRAELEFQGLKQLELSQGNLILETESGSVRFEAPQIYQRIDGRRQHVAGRFVLRGENRAGFEVGSYDHTRELIIDPILSYATYFGGSGDDTSPSIAVDGSGNVYLAGTTDSTPASFPVPSTQTLFPTTLTMNPPSTHVFVAKIVPSTTGITSTAVYESFLGGTGSDTSVGVAVDGGGNAYIAGNTTSVDFPTQPNAYQTKPAAGSKGTSHVFVTVLNSTGNALKYSSYLSGNGTDRASGIAIDAKGDLFVTGTTTSSDQATITDAFPAAAPPTALEPPFQPVPFAATQFFVTKVNTASVGTFSIAYSTYFGGGAPSNPIAVGGGIAVDSTGNIYFTGTTNSIFTGTAGRPPDFPILNAYQPCLDQQPPTTVVNPPTCSNTGTTTNTDAFLARLNPTSPSGPGQLIWSSYFGGAQTDSGVGITIDSGAASVYITGTTNSSDILIPASVASNAPFQRCLDNLFDPTSLACTPGTTNANDAYIAKFSNPAASTTTPTNMALTYFTYLGGSQNEAGTAIAVDTVGNVLLTGLTQSTNPSPGYPTTPTSGNFPVTVGAIQSNLNPGGTPAQDAFFARINTVATTIVNAVGSFVTYYGGSGTDRGTSVAIDLNLNSYFAGDTNSSDLQTQAPLQSTLAGGFDTFAVKLGTAADLTMTGELTLGVGQTFVSAGNPATFTYTITNNGPDVATNIAFSDNFSPTVTGVTLAFNSASISSGSCPATATNGNSVTCGIPTLQAGSTSTVTMSLTPAAGGNFNGGTATLFGTNNIVLGQTSVSGQASDFGLTVSPANQTVSAAGATTSYTATLSPSPVYASAITINCSTGLPSASTCTPTSSSVTLNGPTGVTLNVTTTARPVTTVRSKTGRGLFYAIWLAVPGMAWLGYGAGKNRRRRLAGILMISAVLALLALQPACSGGTTPAVVGGTPAGTYTLTVTATSGTLSHSQNVTLTVP